LVVPSLLALKEGGAFPQQLDAEPDKILCVHREHLDGRAADWRFTYDSGGIKFEVFVPLVDPRMK